MGKTRLELEAEEREHYLQVQRQLGGQTLADILPEAPKPPPMSLEDTALDIQKQVETLSAKRTAIYQALLAGYSIDEVAASFHVPHFEVDEILNQKLKESKDFVPLQNAMDADRLDALIRVLWPSALEGSGSAIERIMRLIEKRRELVKGVDAVGSDADYSHMSTEDLKQLRELQKKAAQKPKAK